MLLVPFVTGAVAAGRNAKLGPVALFFLASLSLLSLRTLLGSMGRNFAHKSPVPEGESHGVSRLARTWALAALASLFAWTWGGVSCRLEVALLAFAVQAFVKKMGRRGRMPAQIIGALGLTSTAAGAFYVATGRLGSRCACDMGAKWLFAADLGPAHE
jgi:asparagine N-glycosylation enzyme membrane subunit Stt3